MGFFSSKQEKLSDENHYKLQKVRSHIEECDPEEKEYDFAVTPQQVDFLIAMFAALVTKYGYMPTITASIDGFNGKDFLPVKVKDNVLYIDHQVVLGDKELVAAVTLSEADTKYILLKAKVEKVA